MGAGKRRHIREQITDILWHALLPLLWPAYIGNGG